LHRPSEGDKRVNSSMDPMIEDVLFVLISSFLFLIATELFLKFWTRERRK